MNLKKILIVYKKSTYQLQALEHREPHFLQLLKDKNEAVTRVQGSHQQHYRMIEQLEAELSKRGIRYQSLVRGTLNRPVDAGKVDLVISIGGDGTFLDVSHHISSVPMLGVNSALSSSFGHFCLANEKNLSATLDAIVGDKLTPLKLLRLEVSINGFVLPELVLNEVLICHPNPAGTSRYFIKIGSVKEEQRSSGVWIGPPTGSTGALRAAGGEVLPIASPKRRYQYLVREPWPRPAQQWQLLGGLVEEKTDVTIVSGMRLGSLYIDGPHIRHRFNLGDKIVVKASKKDLYSFMDPNINQIFARGDIRGRL